jgi:hypothetical protein
MGWLAGWLAGWFSSAYFDTAADRQAEPQSHHLSLAVPCGPAPSLPLLQAEPAGRRVC